MLHPRRQTKPIRVVPTPRFARIDPTLKILLPPRPSLLLGRSLGGAADRWAVRQLQAVPRF